MGNLLNEHNAIGYDEIYKRGRDHLYPNENIVRLVKWFFAKGGHVLDHGFGPGENLIHLLKSGYICSGLETAPNAKKLVENKLEKYPQFQEKVKLHTLKKDDSSLPFQDNYFDYILSNQVVDFVASEEKILHLLAEFRRILKPNGRLIVTMGSKLNDSCIKGTEIEPHIYRFENNYKYRGQAGSYSRLVYVLQDEKHAQELFSSFKIHEIGSFYNHYCGVSGHHFVILASNHPK